MLTVASVIGREFPFEALEILLEQPGRRIIAALEEAVAAGLIREVNEDVGPLLLRALARARDPLREASSTSAGCACTTGSPRRWSRWARYPVSPAELAHHYLREPPPRSRGQGDRLRAARGRAGDGRAGLRGGPRALPPRARRADGRPDADDAGAASCCSAGRRRGRRRRPGGARRSPRPRSWPARQRARSCWPRRRSASAGATPRRSRPEAIALLEEALDALDEADSPLRVEAPRPAGPRHQLPRRAPAGTTRSARAALEMAHRIGDSEALVVSLESRHQALLPSSTSTSGCGQRRADRAGAADRRARGRGAGATHRTSTCSTSATSRAPAGRARRSPRWRRRCGSPLSELVGLLGGPVAADGRPARGGDGSAPSARSRPRTGSPTRKSSGCSSRG